MDDQETCVFLLNKRPGSLNLGSRAKDTERRKSGEAKVVTEGAIQTENLYRNFYFFSTTSEKLEDLQFFLHSSFFLPFLPSGEEEKSEPA